MKALELARVAVARSGFCRPRTTFGSCLLAELRLRRLTFFRYECEKPNEARLRKMEGVLHAIRDEIAAL